MAYYTGSAANIAALMSALSSALTSNGFSASGNVFYKGTLYVELKVPTTGTTPYNRIEVKGGTGRSGSTLTGGIAAFNANYDGTVSLGTCIASGGTELQYPCTYHIHISDSPDEVYMFVNDSGTRWSWLAFGQSGVSGISGTGNWYGASVSSRNNTSIGRVSTTSGSTGTQAGLFCYNSPSGTPTNQVQPFNCSVNHGFDSNPWSMCGNDVGISTGLTSWTVSASSCDASTANTPLWAAQPNAWNGQAILMRIQGYVLRPSSKSSLVLDIQHSRYIRNTNYNDGDILTIGSDQWKIYPFIMKNASTPNGNTSGHSGTIGLAVRYEP
jgi:hypothetical protein